MQDSNNTETTLMKVLYDEHAAALWRYAVRLTGDRTRAEDVVQETLLRAWQHPEVTADAERSARAWLTWTRDETATTVSVAGIGNVGVHYQVTDVAGDTVTYETHFRFPDGSTAVAASRLRFWEPEPLFALLRHAGFAHIEAFGDWDRSPVSPRSPEIIVVAAA